MIDLAEFWDDILAQFEGPKLVRLIAIVGGYVLFRRLFLSHVRTSQLKSLLRDDQRDKEYDLATNPDEMFDRLGVSTGIADSAKQLVEFGWGKKTRRNNKLQQQVLEEKFERMAAHMTEDDDKDIEQFLED